LGQVLPSHDPIDGNGMAFQALNDQEPALRRAGYSKQERQTRLYTSGALWPRRGLSAKRDPDALIEKGPLVHRGPAIRFALQQCDNAGLMPKQQVQDDSWWRSRGFQQQAVAVYAHSGNDQRLTAGPLARDALAMYEVKTMHEFAHNILAFPPRTK
jgi:hypothetical protein